MRAATFISRTLASCAFAGALALSAPAGATQLTNTAWLAPPPDSFTIHWSGGTPAVNPAATGGFTGTFGGIGITFWCFDLLHTFSLGTTYNDYTAFAMLGGVATQLGILYNVAGANGGFGGSPTNSAAFQLAIWNLEYDGDTSLSSGSFYVTGSDAGAIALASTWLGLMSNPIYSQSVPDVTELISGSRHQNFITFNKVPSQCCLQTPEPPMLPLLLTAFGAVALVETRRRMRVRGD